MSLRIWSGSVEYLRFRTWADVPLDMDAPVLSFVPSGDPVTWLPTLWVGSTQIVTNDDGSQRFWRYHNILVGPSDAASVALAKGLWRVWRKLADTPEVPADLLGSVTVF